MTRQAKIWYVFPLENLSIQSVTSTFLTWYMFDSNWIKPPYIWDKAYTMYSLSAQNSFSQWPNWVPAFEKPVHLHLLESDEITKKHFKQISSCSSKCSVNLLQNWMKPENLIQQDICPARSDKLFHIILLHN